MPIPATLDPTVASVAYMELRDCVGWLFANEAPDTLERRRQALEKINHFRPADTTEASFAAQIVALDLHRQDSLRLAAEHRDDAATAVKCRNSATSLSRQSQRTQAKLEAMQQARRLGSVVLARSARDAEAMPGTERLPDWAVQAAAETMPPDSRTVQPEPAGLPANAPAAADPKADAPIAPDVSPEALAKAERYAKANRLLAARIRRAGGMTRQAVAGFRPATYPKDHETLRALLVGQSQTLSALDGAKAERLAA